MIIEFKSPTTYFAAASEQIKRIGASGSGSIIVLETASGFELSALVAEAPALATSIINRQGPASELTLISFSQGAVGPGPTPSLPTIPPAYYSSYENAAQLGQIPGVNVNPYLWYGKGLDNITDTMLYPYAATAASSNFLDPITGADAILSVESDDPADDGNSGGTGAWQVQINGVQIDGTSVSETVTLTGTTPVNTTTAFFRVTDMSVQAYGTNGTNVGNIIIKEQSTGNVQWAMGPEDSNMSGSFTPSSGRGLIVKQATFISTSQFAQVTFWLRFSAFEYNGRRKVFQMPITPAPQVHLFVGAGALPAGIEIIPTVKHTQPLATGQTYDATAYLEVYNFQLP